MKVFSLIAPSLLLLTHSVIFGQQAKPEIRTNIVVVEQSDSPLQLLPAPTETAPHMLRITNTGKLEVRAYTLVSEHPPHDRVQVYISGQPIGVGKTSFNLGPASNTKLYFDYVLFADGTSWGEDKFERSKEIRSTLVARKAAIDRARELISVYPEPGSLLSRLDQWPTLTTSFDLFGPPSQEKLEQGAIGAWKWIIDNLRRNKTRSAEAAVIADQLEREMPIPTPTLVKRSSP